MRHRNSRSEFPIAKQYLAFRQEDFAFPKGKIFVGERFLLFREGCHSDQGGDQPPRGVNPLRLANCIEGQLRLIFKYKQLAEDIVQNNHRNTDQHLGHHAVDAENGLIQTDGYKSGHGDHFKHARCNAGT